MRKTNKPTKAVRRPKRKPATTEELFEKRLKGALRGRLLDPEQLKDFIGIVECVERKQDAIKGALESILDEMSELDRTFKVMSLSLEFLKHWPEPAGKRPTDGSSEAEVDDDD